ncbi:acyl-CoA dehydrogenase [Mycolicibacterium phlei]|uniref:Acyl-CoA dehydrogenase n=1 Tax=Mycolicibacterium phlei DSM 43239 = CCUG 21000 TaxID=1226750 RepID=A0A5N5VCC2_MYCPH|nr:acyl-CoA dehydrogenase family protein [Mycolicibacterium phlei]VEG11677.1 acyl-CoA dehydrogenase [Mycobacteroides chelonae]AMO63583.1 Acyl-CoA dehydrogenase [Mycolicibacterium phlei]KAB7759581.1 acyl-CoA dehydrogenase [Mycolicibacterium phlei DSM 43239 = CCUG 21000]KXW60202.1 acyl-CoA dehydrogenase [Mycolicibacterium phlei DSM 43072]KXW68623.1 acyl-CoA dehydrogenase [Mycolicibacterium phlei DSM 43239 = CCUG 21000]
MHFQLDDEARAFRDDVRAHLDEVLTPEFEERIYRSGVAHDDDFTRGLVEKDLFAPDRRLLERQLLQDELMYSDAPVYLSETTRMVAGVIDKAGSEELKRRIIPKAMAAELTIALGFTEPECGSDVAAASTRAVRSGDDWIINGSKMFTTNGHIADYVFLLARTNPDKPKHKGLTMFLVPLDSPGVEAQAVWTLSGERTNITFYTDVRVSDEYRIGGVDEGWSVLSLALEDEHASGWGPHLKRLLEHAEQWAREATDADGAARISDPDVRRRLSRIAIEFEVATLLQRRCVWMAEQGQSPVAEGPMSKLFSTEALVRAAQDVNEFVGPDALRSRYEPTAPEDGRFEYLMRFSLGTTIYAGTSEVQRTIIAQRGLGLPR